MAALSWSGAPWVADTSAWSRAAAPEVAGAWRAAIRGEEVIACPIVTLEMLYDARDAGEVERVAAGMAGFRQAPVTRSVTDAAIAAIRELAAVGSAGGHRLPLADALIAAAAAERGFGVLHYDRDYDCLATVLHFHSEWIAAPGSLD